MFTSSFNTSHQNFVPSKDVYITNLFKRITDETDRVEKANLEHQLLKALTVCMYVLLDNVLFIYIQILLLDSCKYSFHNTKNCRENLHYRISTNHVS